MKSSIVFMIIDKDLDFIYLLIRSKKRMRPTGISFLFCFINFYLDINVPTIVADLLNA